MTTFNIQVVLEQRRLEPVFDEFVFHYVKDIIELTAEEDEDVLDVTQVFGQLF